MTISVQSYHLLKTGDWRSSNKTRGWYGLGLISLTDRIQAIKILEFVNAATQRPKSDDIIYETKIKQKAIYGTHFVGSKAEEMNDIIKLLEKNIDKLINL